MTNVAVPTNSSEETGVKTKVMARVVGYYSEVNSWNLGQKSSWEDRNLLSLKDKSK